MYHIFSLLILGRDSLYVDVIHCCICLIISIITIIVRLLLVVMFENV